MFPGYRPTSVLWWTRFFGLAPKITLTGHLDHSPKIFLPGGRGLTRWLQASWPARFEVGTWGADAERGARSQAARGTPVPPGTGCEGRR